MGDHWTADEISAEVARTRILAENPGNMRIALMTALALIEGLARLVKPQSERDREDNPPPKQSGE